MNTIFHQLTGLKYYPCDISCVTTVNKQAINSQSKDIFIICIQFVKLEHLNISNGILLFSHKSCLKWETTDVEQQENMDKNKENVLCICQICGNRSHIRKDISQKQNHKIHFDKKNRC